MFENPLNIVAAYILVINSVTFVAYGVDKASARSRARRTPEKTLWLLALAGGSVGALLAMHFFRHKTQKLSFQLVLMLIILTQALLVYGVYWLRYVAS